jgi:hypothetical protein
MWHAAFSYLFSSFQWKSLKVFLHDPFYNKALLMFNVDFSIKCWETIFIGSPILNKPAY